MARGTKLRVEIVTGEREVLVDEGVDMVVAPGIEGQLGILPQHAPLVTTLVPGELRITKGGNEETLAIGGGFLEIGHDRVMVLADTAERSEEIDLARAEEARRGAEAALANPRNVANPAEAQAAMRRSVVRLRVAQRRRRSSGGGDRADRI
ncbi:MAG: ATP synthase epsilon chain [uncultured Thermomicrobiales bacterium]|uniref:ATP synthase epsilon chain n=1 Tax=uncultured Thermomicrobiales bacterium TaxID=1645740 RepID=A0A6J4V9Q5_9BACT|nr:MAG: ATP synthase epsilon chain [uncultured Thermomicrobiales bacterium]